MTVNSFEHIRNLLHCAESRCVYQLNDVAFQNQPAWEEIEKALRFVDELKQVHYEVLNKFLAHPSRFPGRAMATVLKRNGAVLAESLLVIEDIIRKNHSHS
jgi:hypothetical protein